MVPELGTLAVHVLPSPCLPPRIGFSKFAAARDLAPSNPMAISGVVPGSSHKTSLTYVFSSASDREGSLFANAPLNPPPFCRTAHSSSTVVNSVSTRLLFPTAVARSPSTNLKVKNWFSFKLDQPTRLNFRSVGMRT